jgi:hypothetical protein
LAADRDAVLGREKIKMTTATQNLTAREPLPDHEQKKRALSYLHDAWIEAMHDNIDGDCLAQTALFLALAELTTTYGEEAAASYADKLGTRIRNGEFSVQILRQ